MKKLKKYSLSETEFIDVTIFMACLRNVYVVRLLEENKPNEYKEYYQKEIDEINKLFDKFNSKFKTNF